MPIELSLQCDIDGDPQTDFLYIFLAPAETEVVSAILGETWPSCGQKCLLVFYWSTLSHLPSGWRWPRVIPMVEVKLGAAFMLSRWYFKPFSIRMLSQGTRLEFEAGQLICVGGCQLAPELPKLLCTWGEIEVAASSWVKTIVYFWPTGARSQGPALESSLHLWLSLWSSRQDGEI